jgi:hypothetical protein
MSTTAFDEDAQAAEFVFIGVVEELRGISPGDTVEPNNAAAIVRVEEVLHSPDVLVGYAGQLVTVLLREPGRVQTGERAVFFTNGLSFGETLVVQEVNHHPPDGEPAALAGRVSDARTSRTQREMQDQVSRADVIVSGRVADVRTPAAARGLAAAEPGRPVSEHDPMWTEAVIAVDTTVKGEQPQGETIVLFPASEDVAWAHVPKLHPGQEGVFLLHRQERIPELAGAAMVGQQPAFAALDPLDVQPSEELDRVRALSSRTEG